MFQPLIFVLDKLQAMLRFFPSRKKRVASLIVLAAVPVFVLTMAFRMFRSAESTARIEAENEQIRQKISLQIAENERYDAILAEDDLEAFEAYVLRTARERLGLALSGDKVYVDPSVSKTAD